MWVKKTFTQAKLDDGTIVVYDVCGSSPDSYPGFIYLGKGVVYAIDGIPQSYTIKEHFFLKPSSTKPGEFTLTK